MAEDLINQILEDYTKFTKEDYEIFNTYITKKEAEYEKKRAERIANTDIKYLVRRKYVDKYFEKGLKHKEMLINTALEEFNAHKEIVLQCLSILQSLVNNPNIIDKIIDILDATWYGKQDFKQFLTNIINNELNKMNEIHTELYGLRNCPAMFYIPELYGLSYDELKVLPAYCDYHTDNKTDDNNDNTNNTGLRLINNYRVMVDEHYPFLP